MDKSPEKIYGVSQSQFSIARHYGGVMFNGKFYIYDPKEDSLTREDILKKEKKK
jgi:hypothetical protein